MSSLERLLCDEQLSILDDLNINRDELSIETIINQDVVEEYFNDLKSFLKISESLAGIFARNADKIININPELLNDYIKNIELIAKTSEEAAVSFARNAADLYKLDFNEEEIERIINESITINNKGLYYQQIILYGIRIISYLSSHKNNNKIPLLPKDYATRIKEHLTKKNTSKIINLINILRLQGIKSKDITINKDNKIKTLEELIKKNYGKLIKIKKPITALRIYYQIENKKLKNIIEQIIANDYKPTEQYYFEKEYILQTKTINDNETLNTLLNNAIKNINNTKQTSKELIKLTKEKPKTITEYKNLSKQILKEFNKITSQLKTKKKELIKEPLNDAVNQLRTIISYQPKSINGTITIKLDSKDKISQAELLNEVSSCFQLTEGFSRHYSQSYLTTDRINFVGIYNSKGGIIGRFTIVINPDEKKIGLLSRIYSKIDNNLEKEVNNWVKEYAKELSDYQTTGTITLPVKKFYDDTGETVNGIIKLIEAKQTREY